MNYLDAYFFTIPFILNGFCNKTDTLLFTKAKVEEKLQSRLKINVNFFPLEKFVAAAQWQKYVQISIESERNK